MNDDDFHPAYPKPKKREKRPRKGVNKVRPEGKRSYTAEQRARRRAEDMQYRRHSRPAFLMALSRGQGRLVRPDEDIPGEAPQDKLHMLTPDELPLCEVGASETGCNGNLPAMHVHHTKGRGPHLNDMETYLGVCPKCHDFVENNRKIARERGWLLPRNWKVDD